MPEYATWTLEHIEKALEETQREHHAVVMKMKARLQDLHAARDKKLAESESEKLVAGMTDVQKAALSQAIQANGITSDEKIGRPGA